MDWFSRLLDNPQAVISVLALTVSIAAVIRTHLTSKQTLALSKSMERLKRNEVLSSIQKENAPCRRAMETIVKNFEVEQGKAFAEWSDKDKELFVDTYNLNYHNASEDDSYKELSNLVHLYLHNLHTLWREVEDGTYDQRDVLEIFGQSISMDGEWIKLYLAAHRKNHKGQCFWENIPAIVAAADAWKKNKQEDLKMASSQLRRNSNWDVKVRSGNLRRLGN
jgi:hypothetical protein